MIHFQRNPLAAHIAAASGQMDKRRLAFPLAELEALAFSADPPRRLTPALRAAGLGIIPEIQYPSLVDRPLTGPHDPSLRSRLYTAGGAAALSVLTHEAGGRPEDLTIVHASTEIPIIRKDFITDEYQVTEARALGADAVLLIVAALTPSRLGDLMRATWRWGMEALVEVHSIAEGDIAVSAGARVIGVNRRDLRTFSLDLTLIQQLRTRIGPDRVLIAESGIRSVRDAERFRDYGADAVLVGEPITQANDPEAAIRELANISRVPQARPSTRWRPARSW